MTLSKVREALKPFADDAVNWDPGWTAGKIFADDTPIVGGYSLVTVGDLRRARAALALLSAPEGDRADLVRRLRNLTACDSACEGRCRVCPDAVVREAADEIEALSAQVREYSFHVVEQRQRAEAAESALAEAGKVPALKLTQSDRDELEARCRQDTVLRVDSAHALGLLRDIATLIQHIKGNEK